MGNTITYNSSLLTRKRIVILSSLSIFMCAISLFLVPWTHGAGVNSFTATMMEWIVGFFSQNQIEDCAEIMFGEKNGLYDAMIAKNGLGYNIAQGLKGIGIALAFAYCAYALIKELYRYGVGEASPNIMDLFGKFAIKVVITVTIIIYSDTIIDYLQQLGKSLVDILYARVFNLSTFLTTGKEAFQSTWDSSSIFSAVGSVLKDIQGIWQSISIAVQLIPVWLAFQIYTLIIKIMSYSLFFEFAIRRAFMPIAMANIVSEGARSPGLMYIKKYFGMYVRIFVMLVVLMICWNMVYQSLAANMGSLEGIVGSVLAPFVGPAGTAAGIEKSGSIFGAAFDSIFIFFAGLTVIRQSSNYADDVMGLIGR